MSLTSHWGVESLLFTSSMRSLNSFCSMLLQPRGDPIILCFVDFTTAAQAAIALEALQGDKYMLNTLITCLVRLQPCLISCLSYSSQFIILYYCNGLLQCCMRYCFSVHCCFKAPLSCLVGQFCLVFH